MSTFLANLTNEKCSWLILKKIFKEKDLTVGNLKYMLFVIVYSFTKINKKWRKQSIRSLVNVENDLMKHSNFDIEWVKLFIDKDWDCKKLIDHPNFDIEWLEQDMEWDMHAILQHPNFGIEWIEKYPDKDWDREILIDHFKFEWVEKYPDKSWDWKWLSNHKNFKIEWIEKFPDKDWDWEILIDHFKIEWVEKYPDKHWDWSQINLNNDLVKVEEQCRKEYLAAYKIQNWWLHITMSPYYKIGRKFIARDGQEFLDEYNELAG